MREIVERETSKARIELISQIYMLGVLSSTSIGSVISLFNEQSLYFNTTITAKNT